MKVIEEKPIDQVYMHELKEIAEFYEEDIEFALKQAISMQHTEIKKFYELMSLLKEKK